MNTFSGKDQSNQEGIITNQPFWPDMDIGDFSISYRIPNDLDVKAVTEHIIQAMTDINLRLYEFRETKVSEGFKNLNEVLAEVISDESILVVLYRRAVSCRAKATICRDYPTIDRREPAENQAKSAPDTESVYLRYADEAVRQMLGMTDITVEIV